VQGSATADKRRGAASTAASCYGAWMIRLAPLRLALLAAFALAGMAVSAQEAQAPSPRFTLSASDDGGYLRLDTETGAVSHCAETGGRWRCEPAGEPPAPDAEAMARIEARLAGLQAALGGLTEFDTRLSAIERRAPREAAEMRALLTEVETLADEVARLSDAVAAGRPEPPAATAARVGFGTEALSRLGRMVASLKRGVAR